MRRRNRCILYLVFLAMTAIPISCGKGKVPELEFRRNFQGPSWSVASLFPRPEKNDYLIFMLNSKGGSISIVESKAYNILARTGDYHKTNVLELGRAPFDLAILPDNSFIYITDVWRDKVRKLEVDNLTLEETELEFETALISAAKDQSGERSSGTALYFAEIPTDRLIKVDPAYDSVIAELPLPYTPTGMAVTPAGDKIVLTTVEGFLSSVDAKTMTLVQEPGLWLGGRPTRIAIDSAGKRAYVLNRDPSRMDIVDLDEMTADPEPIYFDFPVNNLAFSPDGKSIYLAGSEGLIYIYFVNMGRICGSYASEPMFFDSGPECDATLQEIKVKDCYIRNERWYVIYKERQDFWVVKGSKSGWQTAKAYTGQYYTTDLGQLSFIIKPGELHPSDDDQFYFFTDAGVDPVQVNQYPTGISIVPKSDKPEDGYLVFVSNTGSNTISVIWSNLQKVVWTLH